MIDFVAIGPQRTGTTWLHKMLSAHPGLCLPSGVKETMFFDKNYSKGQDWYRRYFECCEDAKLRGEIAPTYFDAREVPSRIQAHSPNCRVIITMRHPTERAYSLYLHHRSKGRVTASFRDAIVQMPRIVESGRYAKYTPYWVDAFGEERVAFIEFEQIAKSPQTVLDEICHFLGVYALDGTSINPHEKINSARSPKYPFVARIAAASVTHLHDLRLHAIVSILKKIGLGRVYTGGEAPPSISEPDRLYLNSLYADDIRCMKALAGSKQRSRVPGRSHNSVS